MHSQTKWNMQSIQHVLGLLVGLHPVGRAWNTVTEIYPAQISKTTQLTPFNPNKQLFNWSIWPLVCSQCVSIPKAHDHWKCWNILYSLLFYKACVNYSNTLILVPYLLTCNLLELDTFFFLLQWCLLSGNAHISQIYQKEHIFKDSH